MYIDPNVKVEDAKSTGYSFTIVSICGLILLLLIDFEIIPIAIQDYMKILMTIVMGTMFVIFLIIGIRSFLSMNTLKAQASTLTNLDKEIHDWFVAEYHEQLENLSAETTQDSYFLRENFISSTILQKYPTISEDMKEHLIEEIYSDIFSE